MENYVVESILLDARGGAVQANCTDISFFNFGDGAAVPTGATLIIDDVIRIRPGGSYEITGNKNEVNVTKHNYKWDVSTGAVKSAVVTRKKYSS